jgi:hypothetical protein
LALTRPSAKRASHERFLQPERELAAFALEQRQVAGGSPQRRRSAELGLEATFHCPSRTRLERNAFRETCQRNEPLGGKRAEFPARDHLLARPEELGRW